MVKKDPVKKPTLPSTPSDEPISMTIPQTKIAGSARTEQAATTRQKAIGAGLRQIFDEVMHEPVPDQFLELMDELERQDRETSSSDRGEDA